MRSLTVRMRAMGRSPMRDMARLVELEVSDIALTLFQRSATVDPDQARCICRNQPDLLRPSPVEGRRTSW